VDKQQRIIIDLALQILEAADKRSSREKVGTAEVRLALRCLMPHCKERWPLDASWNGAIGEQSAGRAASTTAALNGIRLQLEHRPPSRAVWRNGEQHA
jgi:hypothetical protein